MNRYNRNDKPDWVPPRSIKLLDQVRERVRYLHYSLQTEKAYVYWAKAFVLWTARSHGGFRHPREMGQAEVEGFLTMLATEKQVAPATHRQALNVFRMRLLGAEVRGVSSGSATLKDAINDAMRDWVAHVHDSYYLLGSALGPHPYPLMVREFQSVIGAEARTQCLAHAGRLPDAVVASVGGGSNAIGIFDAFIDDADVRLIGVEAGGEGITPGRHAARFAGGAEGIFQGTRTYLLQDADGNVEGTHSVSAGLDYAAIGPEHAWLRARGRAEYAWADDHAALEAFHRLAHLEGIMPALESAHAIAHLETLGRDLGAGAIVVVNLSGRGDKDVHTVQQLAGGRP